MPGRACPASIPHMYWVLASLFGALAVILAFPTVGWAPLVLLAWTPLLVLARRSTWKQRQGCHPLVHSSLCGEMTRSVKLKARAKEVAAAGNPSQRTRHPEGRARWNQMSAKYAMWARG